MTDDGYGAVENRKGDQVVRNNEISWEDTPGWTSRDADITSPEHIKNYLFKVKWVVSKDKKTHPYLSTEKTITMNTEEGNEGQKVITYVGFDKFSENVEVPDEVDPPGTRRSRRLQGESANQ